MAGATTAATAWADACPAASGFSDVPAGAPYCTNTQWLRNRGITLGCGDGSTFCPDAAVTRAQMALFMNRLGTALSPRVVQADDGGVVTTTGGMNGCSTGTVAAATYPRTVTLTGAVTASAPSAAMVVGVQGVAVLGGTTTPDGHKALASLATGGTVSLPVSGVFALAAGAVSSFYVEVTQAGAPLPATLTRTCHLNVRIDNANNTAPPY